MTDNDNQSNEKQMINLSKYISCFDQPILNVTRSENQAEVNILSCYFYDLSKTINYEEKNQLGSFLYSSMLGSEPGSSFDAKLFEEFMQTVPIRKIVLLDLVVHAWLSETFSNMLYLYQLVYFLSGCACYLNDPKYNLDLDSKPVDEEQNSTVTNSLEFWTGDRYDPEDQKDDDFENKFVVEYLPKFKMLIEFSNSLVESLLLAWIIRSIIIRVFLFLKELLKVNYNFLV